MNLNHPKYNIPCMSDECMVILRSLFQKYNIKRMVEFGSGGSTMMFMNWIPDGGLIISREHNLSFYNKLKEKIKERQDKAKILLQYKPKLNEYPIIEGTYDFIFVDGIQRIPCIQESCQKGKIVAIHDSERGEYEEGYKYLEMYSYSHIPTKTNVRIYINESVNRK